MDLNPKTHGPRSTHSTMTPREWSSLTAASSFTRGHWISSATRARTATTSLPWRRRTTGSHSHPLAIIGVIAILNLNAVVLVDEVENGAGDLDEDLFDGLQRSHFSNPEKLHSNQPLHGSQSQDPRTQVHPQHHDPTRVVKLDGSFVFHQRPLDLIGSTGEDGNDIIALAETDNCEIAGDLDEDLTFIPDEIVSARDLTVILLPLSASSPFSTSTL
nr:hypothetical protein CFP56_51284 [Quercus suber]